MTSMTHHSPRPSLMPLAVACVMAIAGAGPVSAQTAAAPQPVTAGDIAGKPLDDLNLRKDKDKIAPALEAASANPYAVPGQGRCAILNREVASLDAALGPDIDASTSSSTKQKRDRAVGGTARSVVGSLIPFDGVVRLISGANAADAHRALYLYAGSVRRAFLKGYARAKGCRIKPFVLPAPDKK